MAKRPNWVEADISSMAAEEMTARRRASCNFKSIHGPFAGGTDFEFVFQMLGELLLQALFEYLAEMGFRSLALTIRRPRSPWFANIGFVLWGGMAGALSLLISLPR